MNFHAWYDESFEVFKGGSLEELVEQLETALPLLKKLEGIEERVTKHINDGVVEGLQDYLKDPLITISYNDGDAGKILVDFYDDGPADMGHRVVSLQPLVDELCSENYADSEVLDAWAGWLDAAAHQLHDASARQIGRAHV